MPHPTDPKKPLSPTGAAVRIAKPAAGEPAPTIRLNKRMAELGICSRREASRAGVDVYLTKPYQDADLLLQVRSLCSKLPQAEIA